MRHILAIATSFAVAVLATAATAATPAAPRPVFVVDGGGWGHGVGMNQWGAYGQALEGRTYADILSFYYPGTTLDHNAPRSVRVLVVQAAKTLRIWSKGALTVTDAAGAIPQLAAGELALGPRLEIDVGGKATALVGPLTISSVGGSPLTLDGTGYRGGLPSQATARPCRSSTRSRSSSTCTASCRARCHAVGRSRRSRRRPSPHAPMRS